HDQGVPRRGLEYPGAGETNPLWGHDYLATEAPHPLYHGVTKRAARPGAWVDLAAESVGLDSHHLGFSSYSYRSQRKGKHKDDCDSLPSPHIETPSEGMCIRAELSTSSSGRSHPSPPARPASASRAAGSSPPGSSTTSPARCGRAAA